MEKLNVEPRSFVRQNLKRIAAILALCFIALYPLIFMNMKENHEAQHTACQAKCAQHGLTGRMEGRRRLESAPANERRNYERDQTCACR